MRPSSFMNPCTQLEKKEMGDEDFSHLLDISLSVFVGTFFFVFALCYAFRPTFLMCTGPDMRPNGLVNSGRAVLLSIVSAVVITVIFVVLFRDFTA